MTRHPLQSRLWLLVFALGALAQPLYAQAPAGSVGVKTYTGYYNDTAVYFASFESNDVQFAATNGITYAPRLSQVNASALPQMIFFMNAGYPQTVVLQTAPGQGNYSPLWQVVTAQWTGSSPMPLVTSFAAAQQMASQGQLSMTPTGIVFNGPVFMVNRSLNLQDTGTLAPTISPNEFMGINPSIRTAYFMGHQGYYNDQPVTFLGLETSPGEISHAPGAIPVTTLSATALGTAALAGFYAVDGQAPVLDSVPAPLSATVLGGLAPGYVGTAVPAPAAAATAYSPIWTVYHVSFNAGVQPQLLRSVQEIQAAASAGLVTITPGQPDSTFNCPIVSYAQPASTSPTPTSTPAATPTPTPTPIPAPTTGGTPPPTTGY